MNSSAIKNVVIAGGGTAGKPGASGGGASKGRGSGMFGKK